MGYITSYKLIITAPSYAEDLMSELREYSDSAAHALTNDGKINQSCTWYKHAEDLKTFSKRYPKAIFHLYGEGEDNGDLWIKYFENGKMQVCKGVVTYPPFDPNMLK